MQRYLTEMYTLATQNGTSCRDGLSNAHLDFAWNVGLKVRARMRYGCAMHHLSMAACTLSLCLAHVWLGRSCEWLSRGQLIAARSFMRRSALREAVRVVRSRGSSAFKAISLMGLEGFPHQQGTYDASRECCGRADGVMHAVLYSCTGCLHGVAACRTLRMPLRAWWTLTWCSSRRCSKVRTASAKPSKLPHPQPFWPVLTYTPHYLAPCTRHSSCTAQPSTGVSQSGLSLLCCNACGLHALAFLEWPVGSLLPRFALVFRAPQKWS